MTDKELFALAARAWDAIKPANDPVFALCAADHRHNLVCHTRGVVETGGVRTDFERAVWAALHPETIQLIASPDEPKPLIAQAELDAAIVPVLEAVKQPKGEAVVALPDNDAPQVEALGKPKKGRK